MEKEIYHADFDRDHADSPEKPCLILRCADGTLYCGWTNDLPPVWTRTTAERARNTRAAAVRSSSRTAKCSARRAKPCHREAEIKKPDPPAKQALLDSQTGGENADRLRRGRPSLRRARPRRSTRRVCATMSAICGSWACVTACAASQLKNGKERPAASIPASTTCRDRPWDPGETPRSPPRCARHARESIGLRADESDLAPGSGFRQRYVRGRRLTTTASFLSHAPGRRPRSPGGSSRGDDVRWPLEDFALAHLDPHDLPARHGRRSPHAAARARLPARRGMERRARDRRAPA